MNFPSNIGKEGLPNRFSGKESAHKAGDPGSILGSERSPGEGNGNRFQYSCLRNTVDRGATELQKSRAQLSDLKNNNSGKEAFKIDVTSTKTL